MRERRAPDPGAWSAEEKSQVRIVYGMVVGGFLVMAGVVVLVYGLTNDLITNAPVYILGGGLVLMGLVAGAPNVWMPVLAAVLRKVPFGSRDEPQLMPLETIVLPSLSDDEETDI